MTNGHHIAISRISPGQALDEASAHNKANGHRIATSHFSPGLELDAANAHNAKNHFFIALCNLDGDQRESALQSNIENNFFPSEESQTKALERLHPGTLLPLFMYMSNRSECVKKYAEGHKDKVIEKFTSAASFFAGSRDHTVGVVGVEPGELSHFRSYNGMQFSTTLPRVSNYSNSTRHSTPPPGQLRILLVLDITEDTCLALYGEGVLIEVNNKIVDLSSLDSNKYQKGSGVGGARSVFKNYRNPDTGEVLTRAIPPWKTILYLMVVVDANVLEAIMMKHPSVPPSFGDTLAPSAPPTAPSAAPSSSSSSSAPVLNRNSYVPGTSLMRWMATSHPPPTTTTSLTPKRGTKRSSSPSSSTPQRFT